MAKQPIEVIFPPETGAEIGGASIIKGGPNPEGAKKFVDFLLGKEAQTIKTQLGHTYPVRERCRPAARACRRSRRSSWSSTTAGSPSTTGPGSPRSGKRRSGRSADVAGAERLTAFGRLSVPHEASRRPATLRRLLPAEPVTLLVGVGVVALLIVFVLLPVVQVVTFAPLERLPVPRRRMAVGSGPPRTPAAWSCCRRRARPWSGSCTRSRSAGPTCRPGSVPPDRYRSRSSRRPSPWGSPTS